VTPEDIVPWRVQSRLRSQDNVPHEKLSPKTLTAKWRSLSSRGAGAAPRDLLQTGIVAAAAADDDDGCEETDHGGYEVDTNAPDNTLMRDPVDRRQ